jgi:rubredoxin
MPKCRMCGADVASPLKTWWMGRSRIGLFVCPVCGFSFKRGVREAGAA